MRRANSAPLTLNIDSPNLQKGPGILPVCTNPNSKK